MVDLTAKLHQLRLIAEHFSWEDFLRSSIKEKESLGLTKTKEHKMYQYRSGLSAQQLVPAKELADFVPVTTVDDGFCCFRSIATLVNGDESLNEELRLRTVAKMALNKAYYLLMRIYRTD